MDKLRRALSGNEDEEQGIVSQISDTSSLSWSTRIKGFIACFIIGFALSILGSICIFFGNYVLFAVLYTLGSILSILSTGFLVGPLKQLKNMFDPKRAIATVVMLVSLVLTLVAAFVWKSGGLALMFVIIQFLAMTWYSLSYIPYARDTVKKCCQGCLGLS